MDLTSRFSKHIKLNIPMVSSCMDTVTEHAMAIAMAQHGGLGVVHHNCPIDVQAHEVQLVKMYRNGIILDPKILTPESTVADCLAVRKEYGFSGFPVTENGKLGEKLLGIVANRDIDFVDDPMTKIKDIMTKENLLTVSDTMQPHEAVEVLRKSKVDELPQLINVLIGDMSFVGPRPEVADYVDLYTPYQRQVLQVRPGITGLASIRFRNENDLLTASDDPNRTYIEQIMPKKIELDLEYIPHASVFYDIKLIIQTFAVVIKE